MRNEYETFLPLSETTPYFNKVGKNIVFHVDIGEFQYYISGKVLREDTGVDLDKKNKVQLIDNFAAHLFSEIEVKKHN